VALYTADGDLVDMWCPVNFIGELSHLTSEHITDIHRSNRDILTDTFLEEGFSSLASEWWHFSYWDPHWAKFYGKKEALYWMK
jgi:D-alanyl-D-alanine dipeptidase